MTGQLEVARENHLGIIALNRPEAINALNLEMIEGITRTLELWRDDPEIRVVLFEGRGPRGFCAGGDVRWARQMVLDGRPDEADRLFATEYEMNGVIARYPKPVVALSHGAVMGGGIGIAGHCGFRFTTADARFAMPEATIGFVCDVGANFILSKAPVQRALAFVMAGVPVGAADALALGLSDCAFDPERFEAVRAGIAAAAAAERLEAALAALMQAEMVPLDEPDFCLAADRHAGLDWTDVAAIVAGLGEDAMFAQLRLRSPTSLVAIALSHLRARQLAGIGPVLAIDLALAKFCCRQPDFAEGVRAVLVDKDQRPAWRPAGLAAVDAGAIISAIEAAEAAFPR